MSFFTGGRSGADIIKLLGPAPSDPESLAIYDQFRTGMMEGMEKLECVQLLGGALRKELGEEGFRIVSRIMETILQNNMLDLSAAARAPRRSRTEAEFRAEMNQDLRRVIAEHGQMRRAGTLQAYLCG